MKMYIVSHREGTSLCTPEVFFDKKEAEDYINKQLSKLVENYVGYAYDPADTDDKESLVEFNSLMTDEEKVKWGKDTDLISGMCFIGTSDWEEFKITEYEKPVSANAMTGQEIFSMYQVQREIYRKNDFNLYKEIIEKEVKKSNDEVKGIYESLTLEEKDKVLSAAANTFQEHRESECDYDWCVGNSCSYFYDAYEDIILKTGEERSW